MTNREYVMRGLVGSVSMMDLDRHLLNIRRSLNSMGGHMRKASREKWSEEGAKQILEGVAKAFRKQAGYVQDCREMLETIQEIVQPKPEEITGDVHPLHPRE